MKRYRIAVYSGDVIGREATREAVRELQTPLSDPASSANTHEAGGAHRDIALAVEAV